MINNLIKIISVGDLEANCIFLYNKNSDAVIVDPGAEYEKIFKEIKNLNLSVKAILLTHGHYDHVSAVSQIYSKLKCPVFIHRDDLQLYLYQKDMIYEYAKGNIFNNFSFYDNESKIKFSELSYSIIHTPGHSPGSVCIEILDNSKTLITGDTLFKDSIGRTDLPGGSTDAMFVSLKRLVAEYRDYTIIPGHGPVTKMEREILKNPFLREVIN